MAKSNRVRSLQIFSEFALVSIASFLGPHRAYRNLFFVIIGKGAILLDRASLIVVSVAALVQQIIFVRETTQAGIRFVPLFPNIMDRQSANAFEYVTNFVIGAVLVIIISFLVSSETRSRQAAEQLKLEVDEMSLTLERERIARDIHDSLGHALTGLNVQLQLAQKLQTVNPEKSQEAIALARGFGARAVADVRRAVRAVRDSFFDFPVAVQELAETIESGGECKVHLNIDRTALPPQLCHNLFFLIQEGLTNVQRHAHATSVYVDLIREKDQLRLRIKDNGVGFSRQETTPGFGIIGMEERAASLNGIVTVIGTAGEGTDINITIPLQPDELQNQ